MGQASCSPVECAACGDVENTFDFNSARGDRPATARWDYHPTEPEAPQTQRWGAAGQSPLAGESTTASGGSAGDCPAPIFAVMHSRSPALREERELSGLCGMASDSSGSGQPGASPGSGPLPEPRSPGSAPPRQQNLRSLTQQFGRPSARHRPTEPGFESGPLQATSSTTVPPLSALPPRLPLEADAAAAAAHNECGSLHGSGASGDRNPAQTLLQARLPLRLDELKGAKTRSYSVPPSSAAAASTVAVGDDGSSEDESSNTALEDDDLYGNGSSLSFNSDDSDSDEVLGGAVQATRCAQRAAAARERLPALQLGQLKSSAWKGSQDSSMHTGSTLTPQDERADLRKQREELIVKEIRHEREAQQRVRVFLKNHGFKGVCAKKRRLLGFCYPLHVAVGQNDAVTVQALLKAGADPRTTDSSGRTPYQLALSREDGRGSHAAVLNALSSAGAAAVAATTPAAAATPGGAAVTKQHSHSCNCRACTASSSCFSLELKS